MNLFTWSFANKNATTTTIASTAWPTPLSQFGSSDMAASVCTAREPGKRPRCPHAPSSTAHRLIVFGRWGELHRPQKDRGEPRRTAIGEPVAEPFRRNKHDEAQEQREPRRAERAT